MMPPLQTIFKNVHESEHLTTLIRAEAEKLERFFDHIIRLRVLVEKPHRHQQRGAPCHVRIEVDVPVREIVINSSPTRHAMLARLETERVHKSDELDPEHKHVMLAVYDAFRKALRRLRDHARRQTGLIHQHQIGGQP